MHRNEILVGGEVPVIILDDYYDEEELELIWEELELFTYGSKLQNAYATGSAASLSGTPLKSNHGLWLDGVWNNQRHLSNILQINRKVFNNNLQIFRASPHWFFNLFECNLDSTLISYYENNDYYKPHYDEAIITVLSWFNKEPKKFNGGDLIFHYNKQTHQVAYKNNRTVMFPSILRHQVSHIIMETEDQNKKLGRYCITQFLTAK